MSGPKRRLVKFAIVGVAVLGAAGLTIAPTFVCPEGLPPSMNPAAPQRCLGIFLICMSLWFTNLVPLAATGLLAIALLPTLRVLPKEQAFSLYGNTAVFFITGVFLLAAAMISTGLSKRITLIALQRFDRSPRRLVNGVLLSSAFIALWMPSYGVAAMIYPIVTEVVDALQLKRGAYYAKKLFLALAWGAIIGSCGTLLGGARGPLALSLLDQAHPGKSISFLRWMGAALPVVIVMTVIAYVMVQVRIPDDITDIKPATRMLDERVRRLGPMSGPERRLALLMVATILAWILLGNLLGLAVVATLAATAIFLLGIADWNSVQGYVNWGVVLMYGGAVVLGRALTETRAMEWVAGQIISPTTPPALIVVLIVVVTVVLTETISNAAAVAILLPIGYSLGEMTGVNPVMMTLVVTVPAGFAFLLPVSSPPNAISFSAGHYSMREVVQLGWPMTLTAMFVLLVVIVTWWLPVLHINSW